MDLSPTIYIFSTLFALVCVLEECVSASPHSLYQRFMLICARVCVCIVPVNSNKHSHSLTVDRAKSHHTFFSFIFDFPRIRSLFVSITSTGSVCCLSCRIVCVISMGISSHPRAYPFSRRIFVLNFSLCVAERLAEHFRPSLPSFYLPSILSSIHTGWFNFRIKRNPSPGIYMYSQSIRWQSNWLRWWYRFLWRWCVCALYVRPCVRVSLVFR